MSKQGRSRITRFLVGLAVAVVSVVAVGALTSGVTPTTQAECLHQTGCNEHYPQVYCSNHQYYANICEAQAACQYDCCIVDHQSCGDPD